MTHPVRVGSPTLSFMSIMGIVFGMVLFVVIPQHLRWFGLIPLVAYYLWFTYEFWRLKPGKSTLRFVENGIAVSKFVFTPGEISSIVLLHGSFVVKFRKRRMQISVSCEHANVLTFLSEVRDWADKNHVAIRMADNVLYE